MTLAKKGELNFCPYCGSKLNKSRKSKTNYCPYCGEKLAGIYSKQLVCTICHQKIDSYENSLNCSFCESPYHYSCVSKWLSNYNSCPTCQNTFLYPDLKY